MGTPENMLFFKKYFCSMYFIIFRNAFILPLYQQKDIFNYKRNIYQAPNVPQASGLQRWNQVTIFYREPLEGEDTTPRALGQLEDLLWEHQGLERPLLRHPSCNVGHHSGRLLQSRERPGNTLAILGIENELPYRQLGFWSKKPHNTKQKKPNTNKKQQPENSNSQHEEQSSNLNQWMTGVPLDRDLPEEGPGDAGCAAQRHSPSQPGYYSEPPVLCLIKSHPAFKPS